MFNRMLSAGSGGGKVFTKQIAVIYTAGVNTLTFPDFTEIYAVRLGNSNYMTAYFDENGNLQNEGGVAAAARATSISGNTVTVLVANGYETTNYCYVTGI